jgi:hypothetical protein
MACGAGDDAADGATDQVTDADADAAAAANEMFDSDYAQVCRGTGQPRAAEYVAGPGVHPVLMMRSGDGTEYTTDSATLPDGWAAQWPELESTQLVGCATRTSATPAQLCEGYEDDDTGLAWDVQTYDVAYEYTVRVARTAEELGTTSFDVPAGSCPMISSYSEGDPQPVPYYPSAGTGEVEVFVRPFVTGATPAETAGASEAN